MRVHHSRIFSIYILRKLLLTGIILFCLACSSENKEKSGLIVYQDDVAKDMAFIYNGELLTILRYSDTLVKPFFHPVNTLEGTPVTRGWPMDPRPMEPVDHPHQTGLWLNFGDVNGYDFWNNKSGISSENKHRYGRINSQVAQILSHDERSAEFLLVSEWIGGNQERLILDSSYITIKVEKNYWGLQRRSNLHATETLRISDNKEGLFAIRVARELQSDTKSDALVLDSSLSLTKFRAIDDKTGRYFNPDQDQAEKIWGTCNPWVGLNGIIGKDSVCLVIFDHPKNIHHPPRWHARDYGLFSVNNFGNQSYDPGSAKLEIEVNPGESISLLHKILIFSNHPEINTLNSLYDSFTEIEINQPNNE